MDEQKVVKLKVQLGPILGTKWTQMCTKRGLKQTHLLRMIIEQAVTEWENGAGNRIIAATGKSMKSVGRPFDDDITKQGKVARTQIMMTWRSLRNGKFHGNEEGFERLHGNMYRVCLEAESGQDWKKLIRINKLQPWLRSWLGREAELLALIEKEEL